MSAGSGLVHALGGHATAGGPAVQARNHLSRCPGEFANFGEGQVILINELSDHRSAIASHSCLELAESHGWSKAERSSAASYQTIGDVDGASPGKPSAPGFAQCVHDALKRLVQVVRCAVDPAYRCDAPVLV
jgi:hypothetical protein